LIVYWLIFAIVGSSASAGVFSNTDKELLYKRETPQRQIQSREPAKEEKRASSRRKRSQSGNLPNYFAASTVTKPIEVIAPSESLASSIPGLNPGDMLEALIRHSIIAFPDEKAPVVANVTSGKYRGARLVGFSTLEKNSKRIFVKFTKISFRGQVAKVEASGLNEAGQPGLEGEYHSQELKYFTGDFLASMTAAYFDSQVQRIQTFFGPVQDASTESAAKMGLAAGANSTARRFREKLKSNPEFSVLEGSKRLRVIVL
jgi:hypothetical protein